MWWVRQAIIHALSDQSGAFRLPQKQANLLYRIGKAQAILRTELQRAPTARGDRRRGCEVDARGGDEPAPGRRRQRLAVGGDRRGARVPPLGQAGAGHDPLGRLRPAPELACARLLRTALGELDEKEERVLRLRFGLDGADPKTLKEIGEMMNLSRERIRQIEAQALEKLQSLPEVPAAARLPELSASPDGSPSVPATVGGTGFALRDRRRAASRWRPRCALQRQATAGAAPAQARASRAATTTARSSSFEIHNAEPWRGARRVAQDWVARWPVGGARPAVPGPPGTGEDAPGGRPWRASWRCARAPACCSTSSASCSRRCRRPSTARAGRTRGRRPGARARGRGPGPRRSRGGTDHGVGAGRPARRARPRATTQHQRAGPDNRPLIMTTNRPPHRRRRRGATANDALTLRDRLGDALMSRLYEMCQHRPRVADDRLPASACLQRPASVLTE